MNRHRWTVGGGALILLIPVIALIAAMPARADEVMRWRSLIEDASIRFGVPASWIESVMRAESGGQTRLNGLPIRSRAGAMGLMQLMPATWAAMRARLDLGGNPDDPRDNILAGTCYLRLLYDRFGYPGLFGAYNAGPGAYAAYLAGTRRLPGETLAYLGKVGGSPISSVAAVASTSTPPSLFAVQRTASADQADVLQGETSSSLFAVRKPLP